MVSTEKKLNHFLCPSSSEKGKRVQLSTVCQYIKSNLIKDAIDKFCLFLDLIPTDSGIYTCQVRSRSGQAAVSAWLAVLDEETEIRTGAAFNAQPRLSQLPGSPSKPEMVNATGTSITVNWHKPIRTGDSSVRGYQVTYNLYYLLSICLVQA